MLLNVTAAARFAAVLITREPLVLSGELILLFDPFPAKPSMFLYKLK
jgi:hypothetical protein